MSRSTDRDLLFGLLALQNNFIDRDTLVDAFHRWSGDRSRPLDRLLLDRGALTPGRLSLLAGLVEEYVALHGGDVERSLAALSSVGSVREDLSLIAEAHPELQASIALVSAARRDDDPYRTVAQASLGTSTSAGSRFRILRPHARGGLGQVSVALDQELDRPVALKEIQDCTADDPESRARFVQEAEITGKLEHPGIIPVYGLGHDATGRPFYAMRFIQGDSLKEAIAAFHADASLKKDPVRRAARLRELLRRLTDVCNAIAYAHSRGVLHRDLKPGNIMLGPYGETLVVNWGLAKPMSQLDAAGRTTGDGPTLGDVPIRLSGHSGSRDETAAGQVIGTPAFASPEQASGRLDLLGPASDVYGLGATLYALLTGRAPVESGELGEVLRRVQGGEIPPPRSIDPTVPRPLEAICGRAMAIRPPDRYATAQALADDVTRWLDDEPVTAYREPMPSRAWRWVRRHRTPVAVAATSLALAAALVIASRVASEARIHRLQAEAESEVERGTAALLADDPRESQQLLAAALGRIGPEPRLEDLRSRARSLLDEANHRLEEQIRRNHDRARLEAFLAHYDEALWNGTLFTGRDSGAERARASAREALRVFGCKEDGDGAGAAALDLSAVQIDDREKARVRAGCYEVLKLLSLLDATGGRPAGATRPTDGTPDADLFASVDRFLIGLSRYYAHDFNGAAGQFEAALQAYPDHYWSQYFLALCHLRSGRWAEARAGFNACLARKPGSPWPLMLRGYVAGELLDFETAERDFERALAMAPDDYGILVNRGAMRLRRGRHAEAADDLRRAIAREPRQYQAHANLARVSAAQGRWTEAIEQLDRAIGLAPRVARLHRDRARIHLDAGRPEEAMRDFDRAIRLEPEGSPLVHLWRAEGDLAARRPREAIESFDRYERLAAPDAQFYQGRGLARAQLGDYPGAVEDYSRSLRLEPNSNVSTRRGWAYTLHPDELALREFERGIEQNAGNLDAHAGRGYVLARMGRYREAVREAELALPPGIPDWQIPYNVACIYAQAVAKARADSGSPDHRVLADQYGERALALIRAALDSVRDPAKRPGVWRAIAADPALDPIRGSDGFARLEADFGGRSR